MNTLTSSVNAYNEKWQETDKLTYQLIIHSIINSYSVNAEKCPLKVPRIPMRLRGVFIGSAEFLWVSACPELRVGVGAACRSVPSHDHVTVFILTPFVVLLSPGQTWLLLIASHTVLLAVTVPYHLVAVLTLLSTPCIRKADVNLGVRFSRY